MNALADQVNEPKAVTINDHMKGIGAEIAAMEADFANDPKGAQKERNINQRAQAMRATFGGFITRLNKFISAN